MDKFQWIKNHFENRKEVYEWNSLKDIIPNIFEKLQKLELDEIISFAEPDISEKHVMDKQTCR